MPYFYRALHAALLLVASFVVVAQGDGRAATLAQQLDARLVKIEADATSKVADSSLHQLQLLIEFYDERGGQPVWTSATGLNANGQELLQVMQGVQYEGLAPVDYHLPTVSTLNKQMEAEAAAAVAEALAVRAAREKEMAAELAAIAKAEQEAQKLAAEEAKRIAKEEAEAEAKAKAKAKEKAKENAAADEDEDTDDEDSDEDSDESSDEDTDEDADEDDSEVLPEAVPSKLIEAQKPATKVLPMPVAPPPRTVLLVDMELLLTDAYLQLARDRANGVVDPASLDIGWHIPARRTQALAGQGQAAEAGRVREYLQSLKPPAAEYLALEAAMQRYTALAQKGGWATLGGGGMLKLGESDSRRMPLLRKRLNISGDLESTVPLGDPEDFDMNLHHAVKHFQSRHGLKPDGVVGPNTLAVLNIPVADNLAAMRVNLERWRWMPEDLGARHIRVNVPGFHMAVYEDNKPVLDMPVIVGQPDRRTPNFSETMKYLVANPTWEVPPSIAKKDKLPILRENLAYLTEHGFDVLQGWGENEVKIDAATLDWNAYNEKYFPYHLRQNPGPTNALGRIKFMLPNKYNIYLHDTPGKHLFTATTRTFSSGCIRLERPLELADYVLGNDPRWKDKDIRQILEGAPKQILRLKNYIPVHIVYFTSWVDEQGIVNFREDVYNRDQEVLGALHQKTVASQ